MPSSFVFRGGLCETTRLNFQPFMYKNLHFYKCLSSFKFDNKPQYPNFNRDFEYITHFILMFSKMEYDPIMN